MDAHMDELFEKAKRFDESELTKLEDYKLKEKITFLMEEPPRRDTARTPRSSWRST